MKKLLIVALFALPLMGMAQTTLTPQEQLEQAQKQLQEAQAALEQAKAAAAKAAEAKQKAEEEAKAKADAEARAQAEALQKQIKETQEEAARLNAEAAKLSQETPAAQQWSKPETPVLTQPSTTAAKTNDMSKYTAEGVVPEVDGQVVWTFNVDAPGLSASQVYQKLLVALTQLTQGEGQLEGSKVALVDESAHSIVATVREYLVFSSSFLSLDRTEFYYVLETQCRDGGATVKMNRIKYVYTTQTSVDRYTAENWITDKVAVNKKHTKLYRGTGKFRRGTIDRKDAVFKYLNDAIKLL